MKNIEKYKDKILNAEIGNITCCVHDDILHLDCIEDCGECKKNVMKWLLEECKEPTQGVRTMLNIEKYKDQILNIQKEKWLSIECAIGTVRGVHFPCNQKCNACRLLSLTWLFKECKEPILDDAEKKYLSAVIKPFRNRVNYIMKEETFDCPTDCPTEFIHIDLSDGNIADFPNFKANTMYRGMEVDKYYTPEELGL